MKQLFLALSYCLLVTLNVQAQPPKIQNALLWKVSGKDMQKPSYLFGTFHLLTNAFTDTIPAVLQAYRQADKVIGELVLDETPQAPMMEAAMLQGTTLKELMPPPAYANAAKWFSTEAGIELSQLDKLNPMAIMTTAMAITQQKHFPNPSGAIQLDSWFQQSAKKDGKAVAGLEDVKVQIDALFKKISYQRQTELLAEMLSDGVQLQDSMRLMYNAYLAKDLQTLEALMYRGTYSPNEIKVLLDDRNNAWLKQLPGMMQKEALFIAVGALHLTGSTGMVEGLRKMGYTVTPVHF